MVRSYVCMSQLLVFAESVSSNIYASDIIIVGNRVNVPIRIKTLLRFSIVPFLFDNSPINQKYPINVIVWRQIAIKDKQSTILKSFFEFLIHFYRNPFHWLILNYSNNILVRYFRNCLPRQTMNQSVSLCNIQLFNHQFWSLIFIGIFIAFENILKIPNRLMTWISCD